MRVDGWRFNIPSLGDVVVPLGSTVDHRAVAAAKRERPAYVESRLLSIRRGIRLARGMVFIWVRARKGER